MSYTPDFHSGKTVNRSILRRKLQESPESVSTGESPLEKMVSNFFLATRECLFG